MPTFEEVRTHIVDVSLEDEARVLTGDRLAEVMPLRIPPSFFDPDEYPIVSGFDVINFEAHLGINPDVPPIGAFRQAAEIVPTILGFAIEVDDHRAIDNGLYGFGELIFSVPSMVKPPRVSNIEDIDPRLDLTERLARALSEVMRELSDPTIPKISEPKWAKRVNADFVEAYVDEVGQELIDQATTPTENLFAAIQRERMVRAARDEAEKNSGALYLELSKLVDEIVPSIPGLATEPYLIAYSERLLDIVKSYRDKTLTPQKIFAIEE